MIFAMEQKKKEKTTRMLARMVGSTCLPSNNWKKRPESLSTKIKIVHHLTNVWFQINEN